MVEFLERVSFSTERFQIIQNLNLIVISKIINYEEINILDT